MNKWQHIKSGLKKQSLIGISFSTDGDSKCLGGMRAISFDRELRLSLFDGPSLFGDLDVPDWFLCDPNLSSFFFKMLHTWAPS